MFVNNIKEVKEMDERELELYEMSQEEMERIANGDAPQDVDLRFRG